MCTTEKNINLCSNCETGRKDYLLDKSSILCTYINCLNNGTCPMFVQLAIEKTEV